MELPCPSRAVLLTALLALSSCTEGSFPKIPGGTGVSHASPVDIQDPVLVSFVFPKVDGWKSVSANDFSGRSIESETVGFGDQLIVTLKMQRDKAVKPQIRCLSNTGVKTFTAYLTPRHSLSTFGILNFGGKTVFLRDHGKEVELGEGKNSVSSKGLTRLWIGNGFVQAARLRVTGPNGDGGNLEVQCNKALVVRGGRLSQTDAVLSVGGGEKVGLVVPQSQLPSTISVAQSLGY